MNVRRAATLLAHAALMYAFAVPALPTAAAETIVQFHPGITAGELAKANVIQLPRGVHTRDLATLRDDQFIQTPAGKRIGVKRYRALRAMLAAAFADTAKPKPVPFAFLPAPPKGTGIPVALHETAAHLLARPATGIVRLPNGSSVSVAQLKLMVPYVQQQYHVSLAQQHPGPATQITTVAQLKAIPKSAPDSMILEAPHGTRITLGALRESLKTRRMPPAVAPVRK